MVATLGEEGEDIITALAHFLTVQDATFNNEGICIPHYRFSFDISPGLNHPLYKNLKLQIRANFLILHLTY